MGSLVEVSFADLIKLAPSASLIKIKRKKIKSKMSGDYHTKLKGRGMEFDEVRPYQAGDDVRTIDWRVTARTNKTHTKLFREERERPVFITLDNRKNMQFATRGVFKAVQAKKIATLLAWNAQHEGDKVGGQVFSDSECMELKPQSGRPAVLRFVNMLVQSAQKQSQQISFNQVLTRLIHHIHPGNQIYIISDFRGLNQQSGFHLSKLSRHCNVTLVHIFDTFEQKLPKQGVYHLVSGAKNLVINTRNKAVVNRYQNKFQTRVEHLRLFAQKMNLTLIECSTTEKPVEVLRKWI